MSIESVTLPAETAQYTRSIATAGECTQVIVLLASHSDIDDEPEDHARPQLVEALDIERANTRIEFSANEPL